MKNKENAKTNTRVEAGEVNTKHIAALSRESAPWTTALAIRLITALWCESASSAPVTSSSALAIPWQEPTPATFDENEYPKQ